MVKATVVVPVLNEEEKIQKIIVQLVSQTVKPEIIIVDGGSTDKTVEIIKKYSKKFKNIKLYFERGKIRSPANAMNIGWKKAKGDIILFSGVDFILEKRYIEKIVKEFEKHPEADVIRFFSKPIIPKKFPSLISKVSFYRLLSHEKFRLLVFRKAISKKVGFFNPRLGFGEDRNLFKKIEKNLEILDTKQEIKWSAYAFNNFYEFFRRYLWYGRSMPRYLIKNPNDIKVLIYFLFSLILLPSLILSVFFRQAIILSLIACCIYLSRGFWDGIKIYRSYKYFVPLFILPFMELLSVIVMNFGFFQFLIGVRKVGR